MFVRIVFLLLLFGVSASVEAALPKVLKKTDVSLYREIFDLQQKNHLTSAKNKTKDISNKLLMGYVLYDRYFANRYKTSEKEIRDWMKRYSDLPIAGEVYALGQQKKVENLKRPKGLFGSNTNACVKPYRQEPIDLVVEMCFSDSLAETDRQFLTEQKDFFLSLLKKDNLAEAHVLLAQDKLQRLLPRVDFDKMKTALAFSFLLSGQLEQAVALVEEATFFSSQPVPLALWVGGLAYWQLDDFDKAFDFFSDLSDLDGADDFLQVKASYWAARSALAVGDYQNAVIYLQKAAQFPRYFYGMLALATLGQDLNYVWDKPSTPSDEVIGQFSHPALERFYALYQIGKKDWATQELSKLYLEADDEAKGVLMMISEKNGFSDVFQSLTGTLQGEEARYPMPNWRPEGGWKLDKALVYAFVRQESCFNKRAESYVGAVGLMQLMPDTAKALAGNLQCPYSKRSLKDPAYNLRLGQAYLLQLMDYPQVQSNLMFLAAAYNAGPGNLNKWQNSVLYRDDPLLFLEILPSKETRGFVERILINYWVYCNLMGLPMTTLNEVVQGQWPIYVRE